MPLAIPPVEDRTDIEQLWVDLEPPGLFPPDQDSWWGQRRKIYADYLQELADDFAAWYLNMNPNTVDATDMSEWEDMLALPATGSLTLEQRRSRVLSRWARGPFTRTRRRQIVESFIVATFGVAATFTSSGIAFDSSGIPFFSGATSLSGTYNIVENIPGFSYDVRILNTITVDQPGLTRELTRVTPDGISFTITLTATP